MLLTFIIYCQAVDLLFLCLFGVLVSLWAVCSLLHPLAHSKSMSLGYLFSIMLVPCVVSYPVKALYIFPRGAELVGSELWEMCRACFVSSSPDFESQQKHSIFISQVPFSNES